MRQLDNDVQSIYELLSGIEATQRRQGNRLTEIATAQAELRTAQAELRTAQAELTATQAELTATQAQFAATQGEHDSDGQLRVTLFRARP